MIGWKGTEQYDTECRDCRVYNDAGVWSRCEPCGLTYEEHLQLRELRERARDDARSLIMQARERNQYMYTLHETIFDDLDRRAKVSG